MGCWAAGLGLPRGEEKRAETNVLSSSAEMGCWAAGLGLPRGGEKRARRGPDNLPGALLEREKDRDLSRGTFGAIVPHNQWLFTVHRNRLPKPMFELVGGDALLGCWANLSKANTTTNKTNKQKQLKNTEPNILNPERIVPHIFRARA